MKILIVEDDVQLANTIKIGLESDNIIVELVNDGNDGSFLARSFDYDAIILDNSLPKKDGLTICKEVRAVGRLTPVLFLTADCSLENKIRAFEYGADDYMPKPFSITELRARIKAITRRSNVIKQSILKVDDLELDAEKQVVIRDKKRIRITRKEFCLLEYFMRNVGVVISRALIMEHVWTADSNPFSNTVEAHIRNLRKKININSRPNLIVNIPGRGYIIDSPENLERL